MQRPKAVAPTSTTKRKGSPRSPSGTVSKNSPVTSPVTRSRSASASGTATTSSRSNSSGSSSSGSDSSSSDDDGSDSSSSSGSSSSGSSSSSDTEASRGSQRSRASRCSQRSTRSNTSTAIKKTESAAPKQVAATVAPQKKTPSITTKASSTANIPKSNVNVQKKKTSMHTHSVTKQKQLPKASGETVKPPKPKPMLSGSVTNEKTISLSSSTPLLLKAKPDTTNTKIVDKKKSVRKPVLTGRKGSASSTGEDSDIPSSPMKRGASAVKPRPSQQLGAKQNGKATVSKKPPSLLAVKKKAVVPVREKKKKVPEKSTSKKKGLCLKNIFSPDNSSAEEGEEIQKKRKPSASVLERAANVMKKKVRAAAAAAADSNVAAMYSSSLSATSTSLSSSSSGSDSSSEDERGKKSDVVENMDGDGTQSPKSSTSSKKRRPITRRQRGTVRSKTIPTTTVFSDQPQSSITKLHHQSYGSRSPYLTTGWGESDLSDDPAQRPPALIRCPTKSSTKSARFATAGSGGEEEVERRCPFPSCDSSGHLSGKYPTHFMLATCPRYHEFSVEECKENAEERAKRDIERKKYYNPSHPHLKKPTKLSQEGKTWVSRIKEVKEKPCKKMDGIVSEYDHSLWSDALAHAAAKIEEEQSEGISIRSIVIGRFEMACWCESPYPEPLSHTRRIFICEFCLKPVQSGTVLRRHCAKCVWRHPPGDEIYRKDRLSVWEVDGKSQKGYCQNLCLLAKSFLDHKTLYLECDPFLFYVMTVADSQGCHLVGYFSKEKNSFLNYNVSCLLTLPAYQRQGFGRTLIDFSYLLTRVEGRTGSPEKPLSDLGLISYRSYWKDAVLKRMCACASREMSVKDLSMELGVTTADLISTLQFLGMLKYWKGKHLLLKKQDVLEEYLERVRRRGEQRQIEPSCLRWRPYMPPTDQSSS